jgi:hypothetical protein
MRTPAWKLVSWRWRVREAGKKEEKLAVLGVDDGAARNLDSLDDVVGAAADRADRETVTTLWCVLEARSAGKFWEMTYRAVTVGECDVLTGVDRQTVILVVDGGLVDGDTGGRANIESVGVVAAVGDVSSAVVNLDRGDGQVLGVVDAEALDGSVLDVKAGDGRIDHLVRREELGL